MDDAILHVAHVWGIAGAAFLSGFITCCSHAGVPALSIAPVDTLVQQFRKMYNIGKATSPLIAITVTLCNGYSAYCLKDDRSLVGNAISPFALYTAAAICVPLIIPYTVLYMDPTVNSKLLSLGTKVENGAKAKNLGTSEKEIRVMMRSWKKMNFMRAAVVATGAFLAAAATFNSTI